MRNKVYTTLDTEFASRLLSTTDNEACLKLLHGVRYECSHIPPPLRHESGEWLRERGYERMVDAPLLPPGELPR